MKNKSTFLLLILLLQGAQAFSQNERHRIGYEWNPPEAHAVVPEKFVDEDAIYIQNKHFISYDYEFGRRFTGKIFEKVQRKIKILTNKGLEDYSNVVIYRSEFEDVVSLDARTVKADGSVINISNKDIKVRKYRSGYAGNVRVEYKIVLQGVEVGDEIEYVYATENIGVSGSRDVYFNEEIPSMETFFQLEVSPGLVTAVKWFNGLNEPRKSMVDGYALYRWRLRELDGVNNDNYAIKAKELPYVHYYLAGISLPGYKYYPITGKYWELFLRDFQKNLDRHKEDFREMAKEHLPPLDGETNYSKVRNLNNYVNDSLEFVWENSRNPYTTFSKNLEKKQITSIQSYLLYMHVMDSLKVRHQYCLTRDAYDGVLRPKVVNPGQVDNLGCVIYEDSNTLHYLFSSNPVQQYYMDEIPFYLQGANGVFLEWVPVDTNKTYYKDTADITTTHRKIPYCEFKDNFRQVSISPKINLSDEKVDFDVKILYSGVLSSQYRNRWIQRLEGADTTKQISDVHSEIQEEFELDTIFIESKKRESPYHFSLRGNAHGENKIEQMEEGLYSITIDNRFPHLTVATSALERKLNLYPFYQYRDQIDYFLQFDQNVSVLNIENIKKEVKNKVGKFSIEMTKISPQIYRIRSEYTIAAKKIKPSEYGLLKALNQALEDFQSTNLLVQKQ